MCDELAFFGSDTADEKKIIGIMKILANFMKNGKFESFKID